MNIFKLEDYLNKYEFSAKYLLCCSDAQSFGLPDILALASPEDRQLWQDLTLGYTEAYGHPLLRKGIAESFYPNLKADNILCFAGAEEGIYCALHTLIEPNDHVIVFAPYYQSLAEVPKSKGASMTEINLTEQNEWRLDLKQLEQAIRPNTKCVIINFPHNPTGQVIEQEELQALSDLCEKHGIWLFSDEVYRLLGQPKKQWADPAAVAYEKGISLNVMSKAFGLAGLRVGWISCHDTGLIQKMRHQKDYLSICNSAPSEILALIALNNKDKILERNNKIVAENLVLLDAFFEEYRDLFEWVRPQGGCVGFVKYKGPEDMDAFCDRLVHEKNVLLMPASIYNFQGPYFRIGYGRADMKECLEHFREFLKGNL